ncbi:unnamed protein product [Coffea canephora]|uniref:DH200=94 genomic scaffold, scaffold_1511 n=2 Tax=Coffea TaxID=13442 RepID=A0A068VJB2_COFCA|nr:uncharacterized protein LOC113726850 [Coffea arabica]CDP20669.1 unnamed protein product [Coffea canephora]
MDGDEMELNEESDGPRRWSGGVEGYWYWAGASSVQLLWAILSLRRGYAGDSRLMPFKAFGVASLFVGSAASATIGSLRASGIHSVDDMKTLGANIRSGLGIRPRAQDN